MHTDMPRPPAGDQQGGAGPEPVTPRHSSSSIDIVQNHGGLNGPSEGSWGSTGPLECSSIDIVPNPGGLKGPSEGSWGSKGPLECSYVYDVAVHALPQLPMWLRLRHTRAAAVPLEKPSAGGAAPAPAHALPPRVAEGSVSGTCGGACKWPLIEEHRQGRQTAELFEEERRRATGLREREADWRPKGRAGSNSSGRAQARPRHSGLSRSGHEPGRWSHANSTNNATSPEPTPSGLKSPPGATAGGTPH